MQAPERIAAELFPLDGSEPSTVFECRKRAIAAIEADRAQRDDAQLQSNQAAFTVEFDRAAWESMEDEDRMSWVRECEASLNDEAHLIHVVIGSEA